MPQKRNGSPAALVLVFLTLIGFFSFMQLFCTPVMLPLISKSLNLNTAQLGLIWGMSTFGGLFFALPAGLLGDRVGPRWSIFTITIIAAIFLGMRGLAKDTASMATMMFIGGGVVGGLSSLVTKAVFVWFPPTRVGLANGLWYSLSNIGVAVGSAVSAAVLAIALRGWQNTFFLYAAILFVLALLWLIIIREPQNLKSSNTVPLREAFAKSTKSRDVWLCVAACFGVLGLSTEVMGYLPTYLQNIGWREASSSLAFTVFFLSWVVGGFVLPALSDKVRLRKIFFIFPAFIHIIAIGLLVVTTSAVQIWALIVIAGFAYGALMPVLRLVIAETKGIGARYAGTAISIGMGIGGGAGLLFAAVSGNLALTNAILPFIFGPLLCLVCIIPFFFTRETGTRNKVREMGINN